MREVDYLWDKKGSDAEIEQLEVTLSAFAYTAVAPPQLAAKPVAASGWSLNNLLQFRFALAGLCLVVTCVGLGLLAISRTAPTKDISYIDRTNDAAAVSETTPTCDTCGGPGVSYGVMPNSTSNVAATDQTVVNTSPDATVIQAAHYTGPKKKKRKNVKMLYRPTRPLPEVMTAVAVTKEEADAYNKLMLALSITGSKLKIVKDTVAESDRR